MIIHNFFFLDILDPICLLLVRTGDRCCICVVFVSFIPYSIAFNIFQLTETLSYFSDVTFATVLKNRVLLKITVYFGDMESVLAIT